MKAVCSVMSLLLVLVGGVGTLHMPDRDGYPPADRRPAAVLPESPEPAVVYVRDGNIWVASIRAAGTLPKPPSRITSSENDFAPVLSPDGKWVAYLTASGGLESGPARRFELRIVGSGGQDDRLVRASDSLIGRPAWSPDASSLAFVSGDALIAYDIGSATGRVLAENARFSGIGIPQAAWSSDGERVACVLEVAGRATIWSIRLADGAREQLTDWEYADTPYAFSPDDNLTVVRRASDGSRGLVVVEAGGVVTPLLEDVVDFVWAPDGEMLAIRGQSGALSLWERANAERTVIAADGAELLRWVDGRTLAYAAADGIYSVDIPSAGIPSVGIPSVGSGPWPRNAVVTWDAESPDQSASTEYTPVTLDAPWRTQFAGVCGGTNCGPASLGISMEYLGVAHSNDTIRRAINDLVFGDETHCSSSGTSYSQLRWYATDRAGLQASSMWVDLTIDDLMAQIELGRPMVVLAHYRSLPGHETSSYYYDHFIVFQGIRADGLVSYDDPAFYSVGDGNDKTMTQSQFMTAWSSCVAGNPQRSGMVVYGSGSACGAAGLVSPADGAIDTGPDRTLTFSWNAPGGCTPNGYRLRVKTVSDMESGGVTIVDEIVSGAREASIDLPAQWDNTDLFWSVQPCAPCTPVLVGGPWAPSRRFRMEPVRLQLFDGTTYSGPLADLPMPGRHVLEGLVNNRVESVAMPAGTSVRLFKDDLRGPHVCIQGSDGNLWDNVYDDGTTAGNSASFLEAFRQPDCPAVHEHFIFVPLLNYQEPPEPPCVDLIVNGGFETEAGWTRNNGAEYSSAVVHNGSRSMLVPNDGASYVSASQSLALPAGETATLRYWMNPTCSGCDPGDKQYVWIRDQVGSTHYLLPFSQDDTRTWTQQEHDVSIFAGQTVMLYFSVHGDNDGETIAVYVDEVALEACP